MEHNTIGNNIRRLRLTRGFTQEHVADLAKISVASLRNYESGKAMPKINTLMSIASQLGVGIADLATIPRSLTAVRFRASNKLNTREQILIDAAGWLDDYIGLEELTGSSEGWKLCHLTADSPELLAVDVRQELGISSEPIRDICGLLEKSGTKVFPRAVNSEYFFGLSIGASDGGPAIVVNTWDRIPVERWIFSAAHELGHILMHIDSFDPNRQDEEQNEEDEANRFAAHFLMPELIFDKEWEETRGQPLLDRVFKIKRMLRVSYATVLYRLQQKGYPRVWESFHSQYQRRYGHSLSRKDEPIPLTPEAFKVVENRASQEPKRLDSVDFVEDRLSRLVRQAIDSELITRDRAAEILRITPEEMIERMQDWVA